MTAVQLRDNRGVRMRTTPNAHGIRRDARFLPINVPGGHPQVLHACGNRRGIAGHLQDRDRFAGGKRAARGLDARRTRHLRAGSADSTKCGFFQRDVKPPAFQFRCAVAQKRQIVLEMRADIARNLPTLRADVPTFGGFGHGHLVAHCHRTAIDFWFGRGR